MSDHIITLWYAVLSVPDFWMQMTIISIAIYFGWRPVK